jgi:hypothetical protein
VSAVVAHVAKVQVLLILSDFFGVSIADSLDTESAQGGCIGAVDYVEASVIVVIIGPITVVPIEKGGGTVYKGVQFAYLVGPDFGGGIFATAVVSVGFRVVV